MKKEKLLQVRCPDCGAVLAESNDLKELLHKSYMCDGPHDEVLTFISEIKHISQKKEIVYNKLVRDRIPEIIKKTGSKCKCHIITDDNEYLEKLHEKLQEEIEEFKAKPSTEEFADVLEVMEAISKFYGFHIDAIKDAKKDKKAKRGGFDKRIVLETTD